MVSDRVAVVARVASSPERVVENSVISWSNAQSTSRLPVAVNSVVVFSIITSSHDVVSSSVAADIAHASARMCFFLVIFLLSLCAKLRRILDMIKKFLLNLYRREIFIVLLFVVILWCR